MYLRFISRPIISICVAISFFVAAAPVFVADASEFNHPWKNKQRAIILDAYEKNHLDWIKISKNKQIRAFIGKASDGLASPYACSGNKSEQTICKKSFQNYFMKQQLYYTRKTLAKNLGLKWGAYHLGRPGNPIAQANHFLQFAKPEADELIALDIEHDDPKKWISFKDAEIFARHIYKRIGRYPVLYTNHDTAKKIAARRAEFPILSRLPLWYARFRGNINGVFPLGNWKTYDMWQFSAGANCNKRRCLYRVNGAPNNIDVNVSPLTIAQFDKAWPFDGLVPELPVENKDELLLVEKKQPNKVETNLVRLASFDAGAPQETPITSAFLKELGVEKLVVPQRSPRKPSATLNASLDASVDGDAVQLRVNIVSRESGRPRVARWPGEPFVTAFAD